jgi:ABC-2 type transport system permease protein
MKDLTVWRVEWLRLVRTRRLLALVIVFMFFGFVEPLGARYTQQLVDSAGSAQQIKITVPPPVPADGINGYVGDAMLIGLIVSVIVAAFACAIDAKPALAVFYRTRARSYRALLLPRVAVTALGVVGGYLVGLLVAWYETAVLIGAPETGPMLFSAVLGSVYLAFAVAVTALAGTVTRGTSGTVGLTLVILLLFPILGELPALAPWMPSALVGAPNALLRHTASDHYPRAVIGSVLLSAAALALASFRGDRREAG